MHDYSHIQMHVIQPFTHEKKNSHKYIKSERLT